jgi:hypothetical protein
MGPSYCLRCILAPGGPDARLIASIPETPERLTLNPTPVLGAPGVAPAARRPRARTGRPRPRERGTGPRRAAWASPCGPASSRSPGPVTTGPTTPPHGARGDQPQPGDRPADPAAGACHHPAPPPAPATGAGGSECHRPGSCSSSTAPATTGSRAGPWLNLVEAVDAATGKIIAVVYRNQEDSPPSSPSATGESSPTTTRLGSAGSSSTCPASTVAGATPAARWRSASASTAASSSATATGAWASAGPRSTWPARAASRPPVRSSTRPGSSSGVAAH